jgi:hypothetical protein
MVAQLVVLLVVIAFDGGIFDRAIHALDLDIRPRVVRCGHAYCILKHMSCWSSLAENRVCFGYGAA